MEPPAPSSHSAAGAPKIAALILPDPVPPTADVTAFLQAHFEDVLEVAAPGRTAKSAPGAQPAPAGGATVLRAAAVARQRGMTHIVTLPAGARLTPDDIHRLKATVQRHPEAVVVGHRRPENSRALPARGPHRPFANFLLRLQTGRSLHDAACGLRAYPLRILDKLTIWSMGELFDTEVLVRAAWAGVALEEVAVSVSSGGGRFRRPPVPTLTNAAKAFLLHLHLTMRSITPLPHRKIVDRAGRPGEKISVLHPLRSIKTLLTENTTPGRLSLAGALGVYLGTLPLIAFHTVAILFAAGYLRLNKVAALATSQLCMPPFVPALCIEVGHFIRHGAFLTDISLQTIGYQALERLYEWLIGALLLAPVLAAAVAGVVYLLAWLVRKGVIEKD